MSVVEIKVPDIGDYKEVPVIEVAVKVRSEEHTSELQSP